MGRNQLTESHDGAYSVHYRYGADGERAVKYNATNGEETLYFNSLWQMRNGDAQWVQSKHIYVGETRVGTKYNSEGNGNTGAEAERIYYYHEDHLGSAQVVTDYAGRLYERLEYTPYGETWIEKRYGNGVTDVPCRFTGKEQDGETGLYYYGARYLDPKTGRWLSGDPALGDYLPGAPINEEAKKNNQNLPGGGGIFNLVNLHVYHYAGNNPVKYTDPDGRIDVRVGGGIGLIAVKLRIQYKNNKLTLGIKVGVGYGFEAKVILTDQEEDIGVKIAASTEGSAEIKIGEQGSAGLEAEISYGSHGESQNKMTATLTVPGSDLSAEISIDKGKVESGVSESIEYGVSGMVFAGIGYETTTEFEKKE